jgi:glycosyltransferase involved in cell wall biosynthesis
MKILLYTHTFYPNIGGVEDLAHVLAQGWTKAGHQVTVVTPTTCNQERSVDYSIARNPSPLALWQLVARNDVVHANGTTMRLFPIAKLLGKPFSWSHHGYQLTCIDGAGWTQGRPAPLKPGASFLHHLKHAGMSDALTGGVKLWLKRMVASVVSANVATSRHLAKRQPLPRQRVIYNPIDQNLFAFPSPEQAAQNIAEASTTFTFVGRLISEKGVDDLLHAFRDVYLEEKHIAIDNTLARLPTLKIIGDGPLKNALQNLARQLHIDSQITWDYCSGSELKEQLAKAGICIIPSAWEEPGALIVLEMLALGKPIIVSSRGWLQECAGEACLSFPNGDRLALAKVMKDLSADKNLQCKLSAKALNRMKTFDSNESMQAYITMFEEILGLSKT